MAAVKVSSCKRARNATVSGAGYIAGEDPGIVTINSVASARYVIVFHRRSALAVHSVFSAADGTFRINGLDPLQEFDVVARDWSNTYNDVIVSRVLPQPY